MAEKTIFPREEKADVLFNKILNDPWACEKLQGTFCNSLFCNEDNNFPLSPAEFSQALFNAYHNRDLSAFLMAICQNTLFDLLRNSFLIPYRFNADGRTNPIIMTDDSGNYQHFYDVYCDLDNKKNIYFAQAYRYRHAYASEKMDMEQQILEKNTGVLIIRELPDTVKLKETEAEAYSAVWDLMIKLEKSLPMAYIFYGQDSLVEENALRLRKIPSLDLPDSLFLKNLERHVKKAEAIIYAEE